MKTIEISAMTVAAAIESGDLFVLQRQVSETPVPLSVPEDLLLKAGQDLSGQIINWTDSTGTTQEITLGGLLAEAQKSTAFAGSVYTDQDGYIRAIPANVGVLPSDLTLNGGVYMAGASALPTVLSDNGGVIMTDGSVYFPGTFSNGGVLTVNPNASGA